MKGTNGAVSKKRSCHFTKIPHLDKKNVKEAREQADPCFTGAKIYKGCANGLIFQPYKPHL